MSYFYKSNLNEYSRADQIEIQLDDGTTAILRRGRYYDLTANEVARARQYIELVSVAAPADEEPVGLQRIPIRGNPLDGQVPVWEEDEGAFVPGNAGIGGAGNVVGLVDAVASPNGHYWVLSSDNTGNLITTDVGTTPPDIESMVVGGIGINVKISPYNAVGNGIADDRAAIQAAIDDASAAGGGLVFVPSGSYRLGATLVLKSNVILLGAGRSTKLLINDGWSGEGISATGTSGTAINVSGDYARGASVITTATPHGLSTGDYVRVIGQRNALSDDAAADWRLGYGTPGSGTAYYGEFLQVNIVNSATQFTAYSGLVFPDYRDDATLETDPTARASTTIQKVTFVEDATVSGFYVEVAAGSPTTQNFVRATRSRNVQVRDCYVDRGANQGSAVRFYNCLDCTAENVSCEYLQGVALPDTDHFKYTSFVAVSSQACEFRRCTSRNSGQNFDITYENSGVVSLFITIDDCRVYSPWSSGMTSHGGSYANTFTNNRMYGVHQGVVCRSRNSVISGNTAIYNGEESGFPTSDTHYGFGLYEGWAADCVIEGNTAVGFNAGVAIVDGADAGETFRYAGATISGNTIKLCTYGVQRFKAATAAIDCTGVVIANNVFRDIGTNAIYLESVDDYAITGNVGTLLTGGIRLDDCNYGAISGNMLHARTALVGSGVFLDPTSTFVTITGNTLRDWLNATYLSVGSTDNTIASNRAPGCTNAVTLGSLGNIIHGMKYTGSVNVASASTITILGDQHYVSLTGSTPVNTITADYIGRVIYIRISATATITNTGNVKLAATFGGAADEMLALVCDGINWRPLIRDA